MKECYFYSKVKHQNISICQMSRTTYNTSTSPLYLYIMMQDNIPFIPHDLCLSQRS